MNQQIRRGNPRELAKIALIPVLVIGLGFVVFWDQDDVAAPTFTESGVGEVAAPETGNGRATSDPDRRVEWPDIELTETLWRNPFSPPESLAAPVEMAGEETAPPAPVADLDDEKIQRLIGTLDLQAVYQSERGPAALIGARVVHIGDPVGDHLRVAEIRPDGITLELADE